MGAWIEMLYLSSSVFSASVAPLVGAWIEICDYLIHSHVHTVAPLVGAWIEIFTSSTTLSACSVAPLVGAWIEIQSQACWKWMATSLLSWERGLKSKDAGLHLHGLRRSSRGSVD